MILAILQALLTVAACFGLWRFWRVLDGRGAASRIITAGFLIRALGAQLLFWISWLRIPVARSLQLGDGLWFFALDGKMYLGFTRELISRGVKAIVFIDSSYPSRTFAQAFTLFAAAFGAVASTAILLNCLAYLAICALILRIGDRAAENERTFALAALAFGPSAILWSLQPLKDTFFILLIVAMAAACKEWQRLWRHAGSLRAIVLCGAVMCAIVYTISGTRWYVGGIVTGASLIFLALVANVPGRRLAASVVAVLLFLILGQAFRLGGDPDLPWPVRRALDPRALIQPRAETRQVTRFLASTRRGFENAGGATSIVPGQALLQPAPIATPAARRAPIAATKTAAPSIRNGAVVTPTSRKVAAAIVGGSAAMFLPRALAQPLGLVQIGGGRGFWLFADADTLVFDLVVVCAFGYCAWSLVRRRTGVTPLWILLVLIFAALTGPMIYSVTNFGTLFRLRLMMYVLAALLPLTMARPEPAD